MHFSHPTSLCLVFAKGRSKRQSVHNLRIFSGSDAHRFAIPELQDFHGAVPSFKVQQVDTTGAGDAFVGALLRKIVQDPSSLQVSWENFFFIDPKDCRFYIGPSLFSFTMSLKLDARCDCTGSEEA